MAKIRKVLLQKIPEYVEVSNSNTNKIIVNTHIVFHPLDIKLEMEYQLYLFVYVIHGREDIPILISNWDNSKLHRIVKEKRRDDFLGKARFLIKSKNSKNNELAVKKQMTMELGNRTERTSVFIRNFEVFASLIPAINKASARSDFYESKLVFK